MIFEIHITEDVEFGDSPIIHKSLNKLGYKTISIQNIMGNGDLEEDIQHMSSVIVKGDELTAYKTLVKLVAQLQNDYAKISRMKIECPLEGNALNEEIYLETHFIPNGNTTLPISKNISNGKLLATDREYNPNNWEVFASKYADKELEVCIFDSCAGMDTNWFKSYGINNASRK